MIISLEEAKEVLRVDGNYMDMQIVALIESIPPYLETTTGKTWLDGPINPLVKTTAQFILMLWFEPYQDDKDKIKRTIDSLLIVLTAMARGK